MSLLLDNAVVSIQLGMEDFAADDERRVVSAARNIYAGVLLLCKEVLRSISPPNSNDVLIRVRKKAVKEADGSVRFVGDGRKTIDRAEIEETFKQLQLAVDLSKLKRLADIRNDIEHMHPSVGPALIQEVLADAMPIVRAIIVNELRAEPPEVLGAETWAALLSEAKVFKEEQAACRASFDGIDWETDALASALDEFQCPHCASKLLRNDNATATKVSQLLFVCSKCGLEAASEDVIEAAIGESLEWDAHVAIHDGDDAPVENCPECGRDTFITRENCCALCGFSLDGYDCAICSNPLTLDDYRYGDGNLCSYHHYMMSKDD
jgi:predicted RNA-binding Zn-ribbon protein involved in translation (DUF1610 family)